MLLDVVLTDDEELLELVDTEELLEEEVLTVDEELEIEDEDEDVDVERVPLYSPLISAELNALENTATSSIIADEE